jgi:hypothetical protein
MRAALHDAPHIYEPHLIIFGLCCVLRVSLCLFIVGCAALMRAALHVAYMDHLLFIVCNVIYYLIEELQSAVCLLISYYACCV